MNQLNDLGWAAVLFASTNIDDIVLLLAFFSDDRTDPAHVVAGQFAGIATLVGVSLMAALIASRALPTGYSGLLGVVPIVLGVKRLFIQRNLP